MRIKDLPSASSFTSTDYIAVDSSVVNRTVKMTVQQLMDLFQPSKRSASLSQFITLNSNEYAHISEASYVKCGRLCQLYFTITLDKDLAVATDGSSDLTGLLLGTINNTYRPHMKTAAVPMSGVIAMCEIMADGRIYFQRFPRGGTAYQTGTTITFGATYIWQN